MIEIQFLYTNIYDELLIHEYSYSKEYLEKQDIDYHKMNMKDKEKLEEELCLVVDDCYELTEWRWIIYS